MSARQVAEFLGLNESSIYRWEWRESEPVPRYYAVALRYGLLEWPRRHRDYPHHHRYPPGVQFERDPELTNASP